MSRQDACVELISASLHGRREKRFPPSESFEKEVMPVILFYAIKRASLLMEIGFSELIQLALLIIALIKLVKNDKK